MPTRRMMLGFSATAALATAALAAPRPAFALTLDEARNRGLVGERPDGYIGIVRDEAGVRALVDSINRQRRDRYEATARETNRARSEVEAVAGRSLIDRAQPGWYVMGSDGSWRQK